MAPPRDVDPFGLLHVMSRGNFRQDVFLDDEHYANWIRRFDIVSRRYRWTVLDWCLIPNHYHLLLRLNGGGLSDGMRELNGCFSRWSNYRTGRTNTGHLWKNRFRSLDVSREGHFWEVARYLPINPVAAGLCRAPEDWPWSGYRAALGLEFPYRFHQPAELLRYFDRRPDIAREKYRALVHEGLVRGGHVATSDHGVFAPP